VRLRVDALLLALLLAGGAAAGQSPAPNYTPVTREDIQSAVAKLRADPSLGSEKKIRSLRWTGSRKASPSPPPGRTSPSWILGLFEFMSQSASLLLWIAGAVAAAIAVVWIIRWLKAYVPAPSMALPPGVERVAGMDIRPESLPVDVGAAALALLEAGRTRDALSLLYRGALSRAVHRYGVAIDESYTEGEAVAAVNARLDAPRAAYISNLVGIWQRAVYAGDAVARDAVAGLCRGFQPALDGVPG
jgi:Domain of unknown function (DUF4129)